MPGHIEQHFRERLLNDKYPKGYPFVTVSRQTGAGGRRLSEALHRATEQRRYNDLFRGWKVIDQILCDELLADPNIHVSLDELVHEDYNASLKDFFKDVFGKETPQFTVYQRIFKLVRTFAAIGKVILVGRGGCRVTQGMPGGVHVQLVAPEENRTQRMMELTGLDADGALRLLRKKDQERRKMFKDFFNRDMNDPSGYDVVFDSSQTPLETMAEEIIGLIEAKAREVRRL